MMEREGVVGVVCEDGYRGCGEVGECGSWIVVEG